MPDESIIVPIEIVETKAMASLKNVEKAASITVNKIEKDFSGLKATGPIAITADGSQVVKTVGQLKAELAGLRLQMRGEMGVGEFNRLNGMLVQTQRELARVKGAAQGVPSSFRTLGQSSGQATFALTNFGRIAQDLPYGMIGIANNITPLIESMQRLSAQAKETGVSVGKQLMNSLKGGGGLILGVSILTSVMQFAVLGLSAFSRGMGGAKKSADDMGEGVSGLAATLAQSGDEYKKAVSLVNELKINIELAQQGLVSKKAILEKYNDTIGKTTGLVTTLDQAEKELTKNGDAYIKVTLLKAAANLALDQAAKKALEAEQKRLKDQKEFLNLSDKLVGISERSAGAAPGGFIPSGNTLDREKKVLDEQSKKRKEAAIKRSEDEKNTLETIAKNFQTQAAELSKLFGFDVFGGFEVDKATTGDIIARAKAFVKQFGDVLVVPDLEESFTNTKDKILKLAQKLLDDVSKGNFKFRIPVDISIAPNFLPVPGESDPSERFFAELKNKFQEPFVIDPTINIAVFNEKMKAQLDKALKSGDFKGALDLIDVDTSNEAFEGLNEQVKTSAMLINDSLTPAFTEMFDAITEGENPIKAFFDSIIQSVNQVIKRLIAAAIQAAILSAISGGTTSFGSAFGKLFGGGGGIANFGNRVGFAGGGSMAAIQVYGQLRGSDIYLSGVGGGRQVGRAGG